MKKYKIKLVIYMCLFNMALHTNQTNEFPISNQVEVIDEKSNINEILNNQKEISSSLTKQAQEIIEKAFKSWNMYAQRPTALIKKMKTAEQIQNDLNQANQLESTINNILENESNLDFLANLIELINSPELIKEIKQPDRESLWQEFQKIYREYNKNNDFKLINNSVDLKEVLKSCKKLSTKIEQKITTEKEKINNQSIEQIDFFIDHLQSPFTYEDITSKKYPNQNDSMISKDLMLATDVLNNVNKSLDSLGKMFDNTNMQAIKNTVAHAIKSFSSKTTINNEIAKKIVDGIKIGLLAPVKIAIQIAGTSAGAIIGTSASIGTKFSAGIYRSGKRFGKLDITSTTFIAEAVIASVKSLVEIPMISVFGALEGLAIGATLGYNFTKSYTGDVLKLNDVEIKPIKTNLNLENSRDTLAKQPLLLTKDSLSQPVNQKNDISIYDLNKKKFTEQVTLPTNNINTKNKINSAESSMPLSNITVPKANSNGFSAEKPILKRLRTNFL